MHYILIPFIGFLAVVLTACTYSITMVHTEGTASDVVDEEQAPSTTASPNLTIPFKAI